MDRQPRDQTVILRRDQVRGASEFGLADRLPGRQSLAARIALVTTAVAACAVLLTGLVSLGLIHGAAEREVRDSLAADADLVAAAVSGLEPGRPARNVRLTRMLRLFEQQGLSVVLIPASGADRTVPVLTPAEADAVRAGQNLSGVREIEPGRVIYEARATEDGGGVLVYQAAEVAAAPQREARRRLVLALLVGLAGSALVGMGLANRLARPLQRAARAAHRLALGARDVRVEPQGPAEIAGLADAMNRLSAALATSEDRQRQFLLSISHELRTPLTAIRGYAEGLADGVVDPQDAVATGRTMLAEATRLDRLVADLLDLARLGAADFRVDIGEVELGALVAAAAEVWRDRCDREGVALRTELPGTPLVVLTDPTRIRQIIDGLAENALRVTPAGAPIVLATRVEGGDAVVEVRDGGPGLTQDDLAVAFERSALYERYRGVRRVGTGVGLALVAGLAERLGGSAHAGRAPEGGAAFAVRLPLPGG
ncbi:MAG: HAMP domain-containing histidine kinase [Sporichthyaceae bacterium]|nr:HAMP domain-containing histidine kinase [Sporichthyaceae bacterium]